MTTDDRNRRERIAIRDDQTEETEYLTIEEAAALLRVPVATLRWWRSQRHRTAQPQVRPPRAIRQVPAAQMG